MAIEATNGGNGGLYFIVGGLVVDQLREFEVRADVDAVRELAVGVAVVGGERLQGLSVPLHDELRERLARGVRV